MIRNIPKADWDRAKLLSRQADTIDLVNCTMPDGSDCTMPVYSSSALGDDDSDGDAQSKRQKYEEEVRNWAQKHLFYHDEGWKEAAKYSFKVLMGYHVEDARKLRFIYAENAEGDIRDKWTEEIQISAEESSSKSISNSGATVPGYKQVEVKGITKVMRSKHDPISEEAKGEK